MRKSAIYILALAQAKDLSGPRSDGGRAMTELRRLSEHYFLRAGENA